MVDSAVILDSRLQAAVRQKPQTRLFLVSPCACALCTLPAPTIHWVFLAQCIAALREASAVWNATALLAALARLSKCILIKRFGAVSDDNGQSPWISSHFLQIAMNCNNHNMSESSELVKYCTLVSCLSSNIWLLAIYDFAVFYLCKKKYGSR